MNHLHRRNWRLGHSGGCSPQCLHHRTVVAGRELRAYRGCPSGYHTLCRRREDFGSVVGSRWHARCAGVRVYGLCAACLPRCSVWPPQLVRQCCNKKIGIPWISIGNCSRKELRSDLALPQSLGSSGRMACTADRHCCSERFSWHHPTAFRRIRIQVQRLMASVML